MLTRTTERPSVWHVSCIAISSAERTIGWKTKTAQGCETWRPGKAEMLEKSLGHRVVGRALR